MSAVPAWLGLAAAAGWASAAAALWLDRRLARILADGLPALWRCPAAGAPAASAAPPRLLKPAAAALFTAAAPLLADGSAGLRVLPVAMALVICAWLDVRHRILPDLVVLPLAAAGLAWPLAAGDAGGLVAAGLGGAAGLALPLAVRWLGGGRLGWGDVKFLGALGGWLGPAGVAATFALAALLTLAWLGGGRLVTGRPPGGAPFGPAIAAAAAVCMVGGPPAKVGSSILISILGS